MGSWSIFLFDSRNMDSLLCDGLSRCHGTCNTEGGGVRMCMGLNRDHSHNFVSRLSGCTGLVFD
jgi:hypothetical protein